MLFCVSIIRGVPFSRNTRFFLLCCLACVFAQCFLIFQGHRAIACFFSGRFGGFLGPVYTLKRDFCNNGFWVKVAFGMVMVSPCVVWPRPALPGATLEKMCFLAAPVGASKWSTGKRRNTQKQTMFCAFSRGGLQQEIGHLHVKPSVPAAGVLFCNP